MVGFRFKARITVSGKSTGTGDKETPKSLDDDDMTGLPGEFQDPALFRRDAERVSKPIPKQNLPALPVYLVLASAMIGWIGYGWHYNKTHFPVSLAALIAFFGIFLLPFVSLLAFHDRNRRARMCSVLARLAGLRPGAFPVVEDDGPTLYFARETWIGKVVFDRGGEDRNGAVSLVARMKRPAGQLDIHRKGMLHKVFGGSGRDVVLLADGEFDRRFAVSADGHDPAAGFPDAAVADAVLRLAEIGHPWIHVNRSLVRVEVGKDLFSPGKEASLGRFLEDAELIVGRASRETVGAVPGPGPAPVAAVETARPGIAGKLLLFAALAVLAIAGGFSLGEWEFHRRFVRQAGELRGMAGAREMPAIAERDLAGVPGPMQRYLRFAGVVGRKPIRFAHYRFEGSLRESGKTAWRPLRGEYFFTTGKPSVCWYSKIEISRIRHVATYDYYVGGKGRVVTRAMSVFPLRDASDEERVRAVFLKYISELPVYPTAFLDRSLVKWGKSDASSVEAVIGDGFLSSPARFFFHPDGSIARVEIMRSAGRGKGAPPEKWSAVYEAYREFGGFRLPTRFGSEWNREKETVPIAKFTTDRIDLE